MFKKTSFVLLVALAVATTGRADPIVAQTTTETVNQSVFGGSPSLPIQMRATGTNLGGYEFANDITSTSPKVGDIINIVEVDHFTTYVTGGTGASRGTQNTANPQTVTIVAAAQLQITSVAAGQLTTKTLAAQAGMFNTSGLNVLHPASYGATNAAGTTFVTPTAAYSLMAPPPGGVIPGVTGEGDFFTQGQINQQGVNTIANSLQQATALFGDDTKKSGFLVIDPSAVPPGDTLTGNGQLALLTGQLQSGTLPTLTTADQDALNTIFGNLLSGQFGTFGGDPNNPLDFNPSPTVTTGDAEFSLSVNFDPVNFFTGPNVGIPEPATLSLWGLLLASGGIGGAIRRYRSKWAKKA